MDSFGGYAEVEAEDGGCGEGIVSGSEEVEEDAVEALLEEGEPVVVELDDGLEEFDMGLRYEFGNKLFQVHAHIVPQSVCLRYTLTAYGCGLGGLEEGLL